MKNFKIFFGALFLLFFTISCDIEGLNNDVSSLSSVDSGNLSKIFDISKDNSGAVKITPLGDGVSKFLVAFGHGTGIGASAVVMPGNSVIHNYPEGNYTVTITSYDIAGKETVTTYPLNVTYLAPTNLNITRNFLGTALNVIAKADGANGFQILWGDGGASELPTVMTGSLGGEFTVPPHTYTPGVYTLTVTALSGGLAKTVETYPITVYAPYSLPITFENPIQNYSIGGTFGGVDAAIVANPFSGGINTTSSVWKFTKNTGAESWAGTWTPISSPNGVPINIDNGGKFKMLVYATEAGKALHFQLEQASTGIGNQGVDVVIPVANQWQELTFDFSALGIPDGTTFNQYVFQYNLAAKGTGEVIYIDNISQTN